MTARPDPGDRTNEVQINGEWLRLPLKFQPYWDRVALDAPMRAHMNRRGIRLSLHWPDFAGEPQAEIRECNPLFNQRAMIDPPAICESLVLLSVAPPGGMSDHVVYGPPSRNARLRRVGSAYGLDLFLFRQIFEGGPPPNASLGLKEQTFMHFQAQGRSEVRGRCVLDRSFRPARGERSMPDAEITQGIIEGLQSRWPAQCATFDIPRGERIIGDLLFSAHRLPEWSIVWERTRALMSTF